MKKSVITVGISLCMLITLVFSSFAEEIISKKNGLDVMFVMDSSGSMKSNDANGIAMDMVKAFVDTVHSNEIRVGFISYNDKIVSSASPVSVANEEERDKLKALIDTSVYSGNTDIGLGISYAYSLMEPKEDRNCAVVLISDGESDLGNENQGRTLAQSNADLENTVQACQSQGIPVYTVAFGKYDGSKAVLERMAESTNAAAYAAQSPEALIEVFYGIFGDNLSYKIQEVTDSVYAKGNQEIRYLLDEKYLDELDLLLTSPQDIGKTSIYYGDRQIETTSLSHYVVGKVTEVDPEINSLIVNTATSQGQELRAYLISYRSVVPVLEIETTAQRNESVPYRMYFKDKNGSPIQDESFYKKFRWNIAGVMSGREGDMSMQEGPSIQDGMVKGSLKFTDSGSYQIVGELSDNLGNYQFSGKMEVVNTPPSGSLPENRYTIMTPEKTWNLNDYFRDSNGDALQYSMDQDDSEYVQVSLDGSQITVHPKKAGLHPLTLFVSDGEDTLAYPYHIKVLPLWQVYWWVIAIFLILVTVLLWKRFHKPKPELVQIAERKAQNRFSGKLDAYVTLQPEGLEEIPPLTFPMYKLKANKVSLGDLMKGYGEISDSLGLDSIFFIADEGRRMILYHTSDALVMIGNSIVCRQLQYSVGFGDVVYITSPNGAYELEVHYIAMIQ